MYKFRNPDYICAVCGGDLVKIGEENGRTVYSCSNCKVNRVYACPLCHRPTAIWAGNICFRCWLEGKTYLLEKLN